MTNMYSQPSSTQWYEWGNKMTNEENSRFWFVADNC